MTEDLADALTVFELEEVIACADLRMPSWMRSGIASGRLTRAGKRGVKFYHRVSKRLALRHGYPGWTITLRASDTGEIVRLPVA